MNIIDVNIVNIVKNVIKYYLVEKHLENHMNSCIGELKCIKCDKVLSRKQTYQQHINRNKCKNKYKLISI